MYGLSMVEGVTESMVEDDMLEVHYSECRQSEFLKQNI